MNKKSQTIGDGSSTSFTITHGFQTHDVVIAVWDRETGADVVTLCERQDADSVVIRFSEAPAQDEYRVVIIG